MHGTPDTQPSCCSNGTCAEVSLEERYELRDVYDTLDALQVRAANLLFSKESSNESQLPRNAERLVKTFGCTHLSNDAANAILTEVQKTYLALAKEILVVQ